MMRGFGGTVGHTDIRPPQAELQRADDSVFHRSNESFWSGGQHLKHLL
jgi:hypothetical protein